MIPAIRNYINTNFTEAQYQEFLKDLHRFLDTSFLNKVYSNIRINI